MAVEIDGTIYIHSHKETGKCYVGQTTKRPELRWRYKADSYKTSRYFRNAILKHGWDAFDHQIVATNITSQEELDNLEMLWIALLQSNNPVFGYNSESGGSHGIMNAESLKKLSESQKRIGNRPPSALGVKRSEETKARMRAALKISNANPPRERVERVAAKLRGRKIPPEVVAKMRGENSGGAKLTNSQVLEIRKLKQELQLSNAELGRQFGVSDHNISDIVRRRIWTHI
jgi:group I intron endonuclease